MIPMKKCQFQDCNCEATKEIPVLIGPTEEHHTVMVCVNHYKQIVNEEYYVVSMEFKED